jgi:Abortive infection C-terminus
MPDASITELLTVIREAHPAFLATGARADDIRRVMRSMAAIGDALNPLRNRASVAHPNQELLAPAEAMLVINVVRTLLHYIDAKLQLHTVKP